MVIGRGAADLMVSEPDAMQKLPMSGEAVDVRVGGGERKEDQLLLDATEIPLLEHHPSRDACLRLDGAGTHHLR